MYTAIMNYYFKPDFVTQGVALWKQLIGANLASQNGFVRAQLYSHTNGNVIAVGTWKSQSDAENYMRKGDFATLLKQLEPMMEKLPQGSNYTLEYFEKNDDTDY